MDVKSCKELCSFKYAEIISSKLPFYGDKNLQRSSEKQLWSSEQLLSGELEYPGPTGTLPAASREAIVQSLNVQKV